MLDVLILIVLAVALARGFSTGAIRQAASIVGLIVSVVLAVQLMDPVGVLVAGSLGVSDRIAPLVGFVLVLLVVQVALFAVVRMAEAVLGALKLSILNRALGGVVGAAKGALVLSVLFLVLGYVGVPDAEARAESSLYGPVAGVLPVAWDAAADLFPHVERLSRRFGEDVREELPTP